MNTEMKQIGEVEVKQLQELKEKNPQAAVLFNEWANRQRTRDYVDMTRTRYVLSREGKLQDNKLYYNTFKELSNLGFGRIEKRRFFLNANLLSIGKAATEGQKETVMPKKIKRVLKRRVGRPKKNPSRTIVFALRPSIMLEIPENLTIEEASRLIGFIQTIV